MKLSDANPSKPSERHCDGALEKQVDVDWKRPGRDQIGKQFHGLMHLPTSVRYIVYEHALVRGRIFVDITPRPFEEMLNISGW